MSVAESHSGSRPLAILLLERLRRALRHAGWDVQKESHKVGSGSPDLVASKGRRRYVVELKVAREPRRAELQAMLGAALLQSRVYANKLGGSPLAVVGAPHISDALANELRAYAEQFGEGSAWGCLDARGRFDLHGPLLEEVVAPADGQRELFGAWRSGAPSNSVDLFSDLGQWMLKVMLAHALPENLLNGPRVGLKNGSHLAEVAGVSVPHAAKQVARLRGSGFLDEGRRLRLVRVGELLERWRAAALKPAPEWPSKWILPVKDSSAELKRSLAAWIKGKAEPKESRVALALFAAISALDLRFVQGAPLHVYLEDPSPSALEKIGLVRAEPGEQVDVFVRAPRFPESVFRGAVLHDGVPVSDVVQCWLDVSSHPARGEEQGEQLWKRVLQPRLLQPMVEG